MCFSKLTRQIIALNVIGCTVALASASAWAIEFKKLPLVNAPTSMAISEDGKTLAIASDKDDAIAIVDVATAQQTKTFATDRPVSLLYRGDKLLVANADKGTISEFTPSKDWDKTNEYEVGFPTILTLAAPQGQFFKGQLLAGCKNEQKEFHLSIVDITKDKHFETGTRRREAPFVTMSYDGHYFLVQSEVYDGGRITEAKDFRAAATGKDPESIGNVNGWLPWLAQARPGPFWFGDSKLCKGMPPTPFGDDLGVMIVPDRMKPVLYAFRPDSITCRALDGTLTTIGQQPAAFPREYERLRADQGPQQGHDKEHNNKMIDQFQVAVTLDKQLYFYVMSAQEHVVYYAKTDAFDIPKIAEAPVAAPAAEAEAAVPGKLPSKIRAGRGVTVKLTAPAGTTWELMQGPAGARVAPDGTLTWTPTKSQTGPQQFKIRTKLGMRTNFMRLNTDVIDVSDLADAQGGHLAQQHAGTGPTTSGRQTPSSPGSKRPAGSTDEIDLDNFGIHESAGSSLFWTYGGDGRSVLVLQDDSFRTFDASGLKELKKLELERRYKAIFERAEYYVALSDSSVDLLDKTTLKPKKEIELNDGKTVSLAIHPTRHVCFVSCDNGANADDDPDSKGVFTKRPVAIVDEAAGEAHLLDGVFGTWIVADPGGKYIYTGLRHMYKNGRLIDSASGLMNDYGLFDVLTAYELGAKGATQTDQNRNPGVNGSGLVISPDGRYVSYISAAGPEGTRYEIPAFAAPKINSMYSHFKYEGFGRDVSYHPFLDLAVTINKNGAELEIYKIKSGRLAPEYLDALPKFKDVTRVLFTPNGKRLLVAYTNAERGPVIQSIALKLTADDEATIAKNAAAPRHAAVADAAPAVTSSTIRTWTSADGNFTIKAQFITAQGKNVMLKRESDGKIITISIDKLSQADKQAVQNLAAH